MFMAPRVRRGASIVAERRDAHDDRRRRSCIVAEPRCNLTTGRVRRSV
jgi:hypothetical protein